MRTTINFLRFILAVAAVGLICGNMCAAPLTADSLAERLMYQVWSFPQEKIYVVTDRDAYTSGDTVRFRAFLVDAATHTRREQQSHFVYVELRNPFGKVEKRVKIRPEEGIFAGVLPLDEELAEGNYTLCAYTQFMENSGRDYFFRKPLPVVSQLAKRYRIESIFDKDFLTVSLSEKTSGRPVRAENISIIAPDSTFLAEKIKKRDSYSTGISKKMREAGTLLLKFDKYEKYISVPYDTTAISLSFHPEGGYLIPDEENALAFKAIDRKGLGVGMKGMIVDDAGDIVASLIPTHRGMGAVRFTPRAGRRYRAVVDSMSFAIPTANADATVLNVAPLGNDSILVRIRGRYRDGLSLIAHNGGVVSLATDIESPQLRLPRRGLGSGIVQLLLADDMGNVLSSRLIFNHSGYIYGSKVDSLPAGDYAVRAFRAVRPDSTTSLVSGLLLQSELKGHIEDPDYYFRSRDSISDAALDLLLLSQGWERYDIPSALKGHFASPEIALEIGGEISGTVKSRWKGKPMADAVVMVIAPSIDFATQAFTDEEGRFTIDGFDWPDNTPFIIQVFGKSGDKEHNYNINPDSFPDIDIIKTQNYFGDTDKIMDEALLTTGTILLEELEVTAPLTLEESRRQMLTALGVKSFTSKEIDEMHATTYEEVLRKIPGIRVVNGNVVSLQTKGLYNTGSGGSMVELWVDGFQWTPTLAYSSGGLARSGAPEQIGNSLRHEHTYVESMNNTLSEFSATYPFHTIKSIEYYRPSAALIISMSAANAGGALVLTTKDGSDIKDWSKDLFIRGFKPFGYQNAPEAYRPHYIYDPTSDDTIFNAAWLPSVTDDSQIPKQTDTFILIEGFADGFIPVLIRE